MTVSNINTNLLAAAKNTEQTVNARLLHTRQSTAQRLYWGTARNQDVDPWEISGASACGILPKKDSAYDRATKELIKFDHEDNSGYKVNTKTDYSVSTYNCQICNSPWACPMCSSTRAHLLNSKLELVLQRSIEKGLQPVQVLVTLPHSKNSDPKHAIHLLRKHFPTIKKRALFKDLHGDCKAETGYTMQSLSSLEITYSDQNGWHPHLHETWFIPQGWDIENLRESVMEAWKGKLIQEGLFKNQRQIQAFERIGFDLQPLNASNLSYLVKTNGGMESKLTSDAKQQIRSLTKEITGSQTKFANGQSCTPWELLDLYHSGDKKAGALFLQYIDFTKGVRQLTNSRDLYKMTETHGLSEEDILQALHDIDNVDVQTGAPYNQDDYEYFLSSTAERAELTKQNLVYDYKLYLSAYAREWCEGHTDDHTMTTTFLNIPEFIALKTMGFLHNSEYDASAFGKAIPTALTLLRNYYD